MVGGASFLAVVVGHQCTCSSAFECTIALDRYGFVLWVAIVAYMFKTVTTLCARHLVQGIYGIAEHADLAMDVAGAILLTIGSSPLLALVVPEEGVEAIFAGLVVNIVVLTFLAAFFRLKREPLMICWYPLTRDCLFLTFTVLELVYFLDDETVTWQECVIMGITYGAYCGCMVLHGRILRQIGLGSVEEQIDDAIALAMERDFYQAKAFTWHCNCVDGCQIREQPSLGSVLTGAGLKHREAFRVDIERDGPDGMLYLKLEDGRGWVYDHMPGSTDKVCMRDQEWHDQELRERTRLHVLATARPIVRGSGRLALKANNSVDGGDEPAPPDVSAADASGAGGQSLPVLAQLPGIVPNHGDDSVPSGGVSRAAALLHRVEVMPFGILGSRRCFVDGDLVELPKVGPEPDGETAILDALELPCSTSGPSSADPAGVSGAIYRWIGISGENVFPDEVCDGVRNVLDAKIYSYGRTVVIHALGPDLREEQYQADQEAAVGDLALVYARVLEQLVTFGIPTLRLVPISAGDRAGGYVDDFHKMTAEALHAGFGKLDPRTQDALEREHSLLLCIYFEADYDRYATAFQETVKTHQEVEAEEEPVVLEVDIADHKESQPLVPEAMREDPTDLFVTCIMPSAENCYRLFMLSSLVIAPCTYLMADATARLGCDLNVSGTGIKVLVAMVVSLPPVICSVTVARDGQGDMAASGLLGSGLLTVLVGAGVRWFAAAMQSIDLFPAGVRELVLEGVTTLLVFLAVFGVAVMFAFDVDRKWRAICAMGAFYALLFYMRIKR